LSVLLQDVNAGDAEQRTPLHYASGYNHLEIAKMLIDEGANLESTDSKGNTPLHYAAGYGRPQLVRQLTLWLRSATQHNTVYSWRANCAGSFAIHTVTHKTASALQGPGTCTRAQAMHVHAMAAMIWQQ